MQIRIRYCLEAYSKGNITRMMRLYLVYKIPSCYRVICSFVFELYSCCKVKVKVTRVHALRLCTGRTVHRGSRGIALLFHDHSTERGWGVSVTPWPLFTPGKDPVPIVREAGWAPGPVWTGAENLAPTGIRSPDLPVRSQYSCCNPLLLQTVKYLWKACSRL